MNLAPFLFEPNIKKIYFYKKEIYETIYRNRGKSKGFKW